ncbi:MAG: hypothetical protein AAGI17_05745 [Planctomycetota bacterium]
MGLDEPRGSVGGRDGTGDKTFETPQRPRVTPEEELRTSFTTPFPFPGTYEDPRGEALPDDVSQTGTGG